MSAQGVETDNITVRRWIDEDTGRPTRRWYWEARLSGVSVAAGIVKTDTVALTKALDEVIRAAYVAGVSSCSDERPEVAAAVAGDFPCCASRTTGETTE